MKRARTQRELAKALGVSHVAVGKWIKDDRWNLPRRGPWDVAKVKAWRAAVLDTAEPEPQKKSPAPPGAVAAGATAGEMTDLPVKTQVQIHGMLTRIAAQEFRNQIERGEYVRREEVERDGVAKVQAVRAAMQAEARLLPIKLEGKTAAEMERLIEDSFRAICRRFETGGA